MSSLRHSSFQDSWRSAYKRDYAFRIERFKSTGGNVLSGIDIDLKKGINVFVGKNGVGKSSLLKSLYACVVSDESNKKAPSLKGEGEVSISVFKGGDNFSSSHDFSRPGSFSHDASVIGFIFDPSDSLSGVKNSLGGQDNFDELKSGYDDYEFDRDELDTMNYLTNSNYSRVSMTVIEEEFGEFNRIPFFEVEREGVAYSSFGMGLGEMSLFYFYWIYKLVESYKKRAVLFVEEPETFLPPSAQCKIANMIGRAAGELGVPVFLSTHSEHVLKFIKRDCVTIVSRLGREVMARRANNDFDSIKALGLQSPKKAVLCSEDELASSFLKSLIKIGSDSYSEDSFYYHPCGGESNVQEVVSRLDFRHSEFEVLGVLDGDCRGSSLKGEGYVFLPGESPPEVMLIDYMKKVGHERLAGFLNSDAVTCAEALEHAKGEDLHEYISVFAKAVAMGKPLVTEILCNQWVKDSENSGPVSDFLSNLDSAIS